MAAAAKAYEPFEDLGVADAVPRKYIFAEDPFSVASLILSTVSDLGLPVSVNEDYLGVPVVSEEDVHLEGDVSFFVYIDKEDPVKFKFVHKLYQLEFSKIQIFSQEGRGICAVTAEVSVLPGQPKPPFEDQVYQALAEATGAEVPAKPAPVSSQNSGIDSKPFLCVAFASDTEVYAGMHRIIARVSDIATKYANNVIATGFGIGGDNALHVAQTNKDKCRAIVFDALNVFMAFESAPQRHILHYTHPKYVPSKTLPPEPKIFVHTPKQPEATLFQQASSSMYRMLGETEDLYSEIMTKRGELLKGTETEQRQG